MWFSLAQFILQILHDPTLAGIASLVSILASLSAVVKRVMKLLDDLKNLLCFYNETSVLKMKQAC